MRKFALVAALLPLVALADEDKAWKKGLAALEKVGAVDGELHPKELAAILPKCRLFQVTQTFKEGDPEAQGAISRQHQLVVRRDDEHVYERHDGADMVALARAEELVLDKPETAAAFARFAVGEATLEKSGRAWIATVTGTYSGRPGGFELRYLMKLDEKNLLRGLALMPGEGHDAPDEAVAVRLLPEVKRDRVETFELEIGLDRSTKKKTKPAQAIRLMGSRWATELDDEGRASKEVVTVEDFDGTVSPDAPKNGKHVEGVRYRFTLDRKPRTRHAELTSGQTLLIDPVGWGPPLTAELFERSFADPDFLPLAATHAKAVRKGDTWALDPAALLAVYGPSRAKAGEDAKAEATLESVKQGASGRVGTISVSARIPFVASGEEDVLSIAATLRGSLDGSAPPGLVETTVAREGEKLTTRLERAFRDK